MKFSVGPLAVALVTMSGIAVFPALGSADPETPTPTPAVRNKLSHSDTPGLCAGRHPCPNR